jgi:hypothetical protein
LIEAGDRTPHFPKATFEVSGHASGCASRGAVSNYKVDLEEQKIVHIVFGVGVINLLLSNQFFVLTHKCTTTTLCLPKWDRGTQQIRLYLVLYKYCKLPHDYKQGAPQRSTKLNLEVNPLFKNL